MAYRRKPAAPKGRVIITESARHMQPEDLVWITGMSMHDLVQDILRNEGGKYDRILKKTVPAAEAAAGK